MISKIFLNVSKPGKLGFIILKKKVFLSIIQTPMKVMELVNRALKIGKLYRPEPWRLYLIHRRPVVASHSEKQCRKRNSAARIVCHMRKIERQDGSWMIGFLFC